jgi:alpha-tubulin suppressor-like RCC1 family protein
VFAFGDNTFGQLGLISRQGVWSIDSPTPLPINKLYAGENLVPRVTSIAAGGSNSYFTVDVTQPKPSDGSLSKRPGVTADLWACGQGNYGALGNGKWTHVSVGPTKVKTLSSLFEFDEKTGKMVPIRLAYVTVGGTHAGAVMDLVTRTTASDRTSATSDTNFGADVLLWGGNEHYQLGTGKRMNASTPTYIGPLDGAEAAPAVDAQQSGGRRIDEHRLQITPRQTVRLGEGGKGRKVSLEQRIECGENVTAVYSRI